MPIWVPGLVHGNGSYRIQKLKYNSDYHAKATLLLSNWIILQLIFCR